MIRLRKTPLLPAAAAAVILALPIAGCGSAPPGGAGKSADPAFDSDLPVGGTAPSPHDLANATYGGIYEIAVTLAGGVYQGDPPSSDGASRPTLRLLPRPMAAGDLDRGPGDEAAVLLSESSGGSGSLLYLGAVGRVDGKAACLDTVLVGDRPQVRRMTIESDRVRLDLVEAGDGDPACCPSRQTSRWFAMRDGELIEVQAEDLGTLSIATLNGTVWRLAAFDNDDPAPRSPEITLRFDQGAISGSSGCNTYTGAIGQGLPGSITPGPLVTTRRACPVEIMAMEGRYLDRIGAASRFGFLSGRLALQWTIGPESGALLFDEAASAD